MGLYTKQLWSSANDLLAHSPVELSELRRLARTYPLPYDKFALFDRSLGGPNVSSISTNGYARYEAADRDVFRPLQYCAVFFSQGNNIDWSARYIVHMSSLQIETLVKRITHIPHLPLGQLLRKPLMRSKVNRGTSKKLELINRVYVAAKHDVAQTKDMHLFSVEDAVLAYVVCRIVALQLYPLAHLQTSLAIFE